MVDRIDDDGAWRTDLTRRLNYRGAMPCRKPASLKWITGVAVGSMQDFLGHKPVSIMPIPNGTVSEK